MDKRLVKITWVDAEDSAAGTSWHSDEEVEEFSKSVCEVVSVGWLRSETKMYITLVGDYIMQEDGSVTWGRPTKIPTAWCQKVEDLASVECHQSPTPATGK